MSDEVYTLHRGSAPLLISVPHVGTAMPPDQHHRYTERALQAEDTDWFLDRLYGFAKDLGASLIVPQHSRYLIDLNRPSENTPMYAGQNNTELCPTRHFTGHPIYREGQAPDDAEIRRRVAVYWQPYHDALRDELARLHAAHGHAVLFDGHSIQAELPWLFEGRLPDLNLGTADGKSCSPRLREAMADVLAGHSAHSHVIDGRFKGGHITRHYGRPDEAMHTVQMEMGWHCYMREPHDYDEARAAQVLPVLRGLARVLLDTAP